MNFARPALVAAQMLIILDFHKWQQIQLLGTHGTQQKCVYIIRPWSHRGGLTG